jgi:hypothetical protein
MPLRHLTQMQKTIADGTKIDLNFDYTQARNAGCSGKTHTENNAHHKLTSMQCTRPKMTQSKGKQSCSD